MGRVIMAKTSGTIGERKSVTVEGAAIVARCEASET